MLIIWVFVVVIAVVNLVCFVTSSFYQVKKFPSVSCLLLFFNYYYFLNFIYLFGCAGS